jgi:hypothetical protein
MSDDTVSIISETDRTIFRNLSDPRKINFNPPSSSSDAYTQQSSYPAHPQNHLPQQQQHPREQSFLDKYNSEEAPDFTQVVQPTQTTTTQSAQAQPGEQQTYHSSSTAPSPPHPQLTPTPISSSQQSTQPPPPTSSLPTQTQQQTHFPPQPNQQNQQNHSPPPPATAPSAEEFIRDAVRGSGSGSGSSSQDEDLREKQCLLFELYKMERMGKKLTHSYSMRDSRSDMRFEIEMQHNLDDTVSHIRMMKTGCQVVTKGLETLNRKFGPFLPLDGISDELLQQQDQFTRPLEKVYNRYFRFVQMSPILELLLAYAGFVAMFVIKQKLGKSLGNLFRGGVGLEQGSPSQQQTPYMPSPPPPPPPPSSSATSSSSLQYPSSSSTQPSHPSSQHPHLSQQHPHQQQPAHRMRPPPPVPIFAAAEEEDRMSVLTDVDNVEIDG